LEVEEKLLDFLRIQRSKIPAKTEYFCSILAFKFSRFFGIYAKVWRILPKFSEFTPFLWTNLTN